MSGSEPIRTAGAALDGAANALAERFAEIYPMPLRACLAPEAARVLAPLLGREPLRGMDIVVFDASTPPALDPAGPAVLVLAPGDLAGPHREALLAAAQAALPGRPLLVGGTRDRQVLLDAINVWRIARTVPDEDGAAAFFDALDKVFELLRLECGLERAAEQLEHEAKQLEAAVRTLEGTRAKVRHAERLATLGRVTSSLIPVMAGHVAAFQEFAAVATAGGTGRDPRLGDLVGYALAGIRSLESMLEEIRAFSADRSSELQLETHDLDTLVKFAVAFGRYDPLAGSRVVKVDASSGARVRADANRFYQVILNLLRNAFQATRPGARILVATAVEASFAVAVVENEGDPIPPEVLARLFQPFVTTKGEAGMGLGLSMCKTTIERHGGDISCDSGPGRPTRFRIRLPVP
jgi:signal transduction histidine kinase